MLYPRLQLMRRLLSSKGCIYLHCDANASHYIKIVMDEVFGADNFRNEIVVRRIRKNVRERTRVPRLNVGFDSILFYSKSNEHLIEPPMKEYPKPERWHAFDAPELRDGMDYELFGKKPPTGRHWMWSKDKADEAIKEGRLRPNPNTGKPEYFIPESTHILRDNFWDDITAYSFNYNYPTEKKEDMLQLIIEASSSKSDLIADLFCGSGTTAAVAEKIGRRWITADLSKTAIQVTRARLVNQNAAPFLIQNLGNYQRQLIYMRDVKLREMYNIILKLYGAAPREDMQGFGIKQDDRSTLVFVCEPDRPMTGRKAIDLAKQAHLADGKGYRKLVILAWDYEFDFDNDFSRLKAARKEIADCEFKVIPSDVLKYLRKTGMNGGSLADKITFYQKPYLRMGEPNVRQRDGDTVDVRIKIEQYVVLDIPLKDEEKRPEIEKMLAKNFAALIDYWTVDWDYNGEVFRSTWQAMRDRKKGEPVPVVADSSLKKGKKYTIAVRVVDVFGNDASVTKELDLR
jgi:SAM-dependent methyltransferase